MRTTYDAANADHGVKSGTQPLLSTRRPWRTLFANRSSYSRPFSFTEFTQRLKHNLNYFRTNYVEIILSIFFLTLIWRSIAITVFFVVYESWYFLYLSRDEPIVLFNRTIDDRIILVLLSVWLNILVAVLVGGGLVVLYAGFRVTDDLFVEIDGEVDGEEGGMLSFVGSSNSTLRPTY